MVGHPILIGLIGRAGAGKDTIADIASEHWSVARYAFADPLREECSQAWSVDARLFSDRAIKEVALHQLRIGHCIDADFVQYAWHLANLPALKPRTVMQTWGDWKRGLDPDHYVKRASHAFARAGSLDAAAMIVTDVRFANEARFVHDRGGYLVRVKRPGLPPVSSHRSEWSLDDAPVDYVIHNDGDLGALRARVFSVFADIFDSAEAA